MATRQKFGKPQELINILTSATLVAAFSQIRHSRDWKKEKNGKHNGSIQKVHVRTNWYHPFLWSRINAAA